MDLLNAFIHDFGGFFAFIFVGTCGVVALASPFLLISLILNVARIRRALERIADAGESKSEAARGSGLGI